MDRPLRYILDGHEPVPYDGPLDASWGAWFENFNNRRVAFTELSNRVNVSTVFLGTDHNFYAIEGPPILFETMIFVDGSEQGMDRYATWDEAEAGHNAMVVQAQQIARTLTPLIEAPDEEA